MSRDVVHVGFDLSFDDSSFSDDNQKIHFVTPCLDGSFSMEVENAFVFLTVFRNCRVRVKTVSVDVGFDRTQKIRCPPVCQSIVPIARVESGSGTGRDVFM